MANYHELIIAGNYDLVRGFVTGFLAGRSFPAPAVFSRESGIRRMSLGERMLTWAGVQEHLAHVIVEEGVAGDLIREIATDEAGLALKVVSNRRIRNATFGFHYRVFAKAYGDQVREIFASVPSRVAVRYKREPSEKVRPGAQGIEMYTPDHDYELAAEGTASGSFADIFPFFRKASEHPLIQVEEIELEYEG